MTFLEQCDGLSGEVSEEAFLDVFRAGWATIGLPPGAPTDAATASVIGASVDSVDDWLWLASDIPYAIPGPLHRRVILGRLLRFVRGLS